jgi:hypothetical protein
MYVFILQGIWSGMLGGTVLQTIILVWVTLRTDWDKEVKTQFLFSSQITIKKQIGRVHSIKA